MKKIDYKNNKLTKIFLLMGTLLSISVIGILYTLLRSIVICALMSMFICILIIMFIYIIWDMRKSVDCLVDNISQNLDNMILGRDITIFLNQSESIQSALERKLGQLYNILRKSYDGVTTEKQELQVLISDISHQVKTPITTLKILSDTLEKLTTIDSQQVEILSEMNIQIEKIEFLLEALVKISRLEAGTFKMERKEEYFYHTIEKSLKGILISAERKGLQIKIDCPQNICVYHDSKWTAEAIFNLLDNAVKYTAKGNISLRVRRLEMYTRIEVSDTGKGIAMQHQSDIFKRFYRESDVHEVEGIGLGLYLTQQIFELQGGYIDVHSVMGKGTTFEGYLPNFYYKGNDF